jgi:hypothetical protein
MISDRKLYLISLGLYSGLRIFLGLPSRGQRTKTNSRTVRRMRSFLSIEDSLKAFSKPQNFNLNLLNRSS